MRETAREISSNTKERVGGQSCVTRRVFTSIYNSIVPGIYRRNVSRNNPRIFLSHHRRVIRIINPLKSRNVLDVMNRAGSG